MFLKNGQTSLEDIPLNLYGIAPARQTRAKRGVDTSESGCYFFDWDRQAWLYRTDVSVFE